MSPIDGLTRAWRWSVRKILGLWVKVTINPTTPQWFLRRVRGRFAMCSSTRVKRILPYSTMPAQSCSCRAPSGAWPQPTGDWIRPISSSRMPRALWRSAQALCGRRASWCSWSRRRLPTRTSTSISCPVAIFWGRAPLKEDSLWRLLFTEDWVLVGRFRKFLNVVFNGRNTVLYFGEPIAAARGDGRLGSAAERTAACCARCARSCALSVPRPSVRTSRIAGPWWCTFLKTQAVRHAVRREMQARAEQAPAEHRRARPRGARARQRRAALLMARKYALEIAANYSQPFITFMALLLGRLWNRLYDGVEFEHVEKLREIGDGAEIIYVPCHRSHMDYLLLSYVIYRKGFAVPHIAAGVNLNLPVIGRFMRKGGAFFMRRSFKGDALYAAVFTKYLGFMMARGHPLEYFIEGGRSRTGRLLPPRTGMLSMTVRSYLRDPKRPVVFMPVYFGYERIVEGRTYIGELSGRPKEKESVLGLLKSLSVLRSKFGKVHVNLGEPISLDELLEKHNPHWRAAPSPDEESPARLDR